MIIVKFSGGLGNQMFQYAMYKGLERKYPQIKVKADISFYNNDPAHHGFELEHVFDLSNRGLIAYSNPLEYKQVTGEWEPQWWIVKGGFAEKVWAWVNARTRQRAIEESGLYRVQEEFANEILTEQRREERTREILDQIDHLDISKNWYIDGYWQDERYFCDILENLRRDFIFSSLTDADDYKLEERINSEDSVAIHVRRGDYVGTRYDLHLMNYYKNALELITQKSNGNRLKLYVFSEDSEYVRDNFKWLGEYKIIDWHVEGESFRDMQIMSMCKYQIIANSSFSIWAGYLNCRPDKLICYPAQYTDELPSFSRKQLGWVCVDL